MTIETAKFDAATLRVGDILWRKSDLLACTGSEVLCVGKESVFLRHLYSGCEQSWAISTLNGETNDGHLAIRHVERGTETIFDAPVERCPACGKEG